MLLANRRVIFLAVHGETLDQGRLPKPTADSGCDDKTILRDSALAQLAAVGSPQEYSSGGGGASVPTPGALRAWGHLYKGMGLGGAQGAGISARPQQELTRTQACAHTCHG